MPASALRYSRPDPGAPDARRTRTMRPRRKNLLDSFRNASGASPARPIIEAPRPAARLPKTPKPKPAPREDEETGSTRSRQLLLVALFVATSALAGVTYWKVKGESAVDAGAAAGTTTTVAPEPRLGPPEAAMQQPPPAAVPQGRGGTQHDKAFLDATNRFTVRVGQYADDARGRAEALSHYDYLTDAGMPCVMPVRSGKYLILCTGYAPKLDSKLQALRESIAALRGPKGSKRPPFATAWIDNIDNIVQR